MRYCPMLSGQGDALLYEAYKSAEYVNCTPAHLNGLEHLVTHPQHFTC